MSDWGTGASSKKRPQPIIAPKKETWYDCTCVKCGMNYKLNAPPYSVPGAMSSEGFLCRNCRKGAAQHIPSPPPATMQMSIEEKYGAKK